MVKTVAVTGATGFIGSALVAKLVATGWQVRALTRARQASSQKNDASIRWIYGDLDCDGALNELVSGVEAVVHCAGAIRGKSWADFYQTNVIGTQNILRATSNSSCSKFLHISSLAAREPALSWYTQSKFEAEAQVSNFSEKFVTAIYRPAAVYGPGDKAMLPFFKAMRYGVLPVPGNPANRFGLIYVEDLVAAICCWLEAKRPVTGAYSIDDGTPGGYDYRLVAAIAQRVLQKSVRCLAIPMNSMQILAHLNLWLARFFRYAPVLTPGKIRELQHPDWTCDITPLKKELIDWCPSYKLEMVLPDLVRI